MRTAKPHEALVFVLLCENPSSRRFIKSHCLLLTSSVPGRSPPVRTILPVSPLKVSMEPEGRSTNLLTLLWVIYQPHKENAVYSELISKLFSLRVSEQAGSCPSHGHIPSGPVLPRGRRRVALPRCAPQGAVVSHAQGPTGPREERQGPGPGCCSSHPKFLCLVALNFCQEAVPVPSASPGSCLPTPRLQTHDPAGRPGVEARLHP